MKYPQPPEVLKKLSNGARPPVDSLKMVPHSLYYALVSIPMPWQPLKYVEVAYHIDGSISFVRDRYRVTEREFKKRWSFVRRCRKGRNCVSLPAEPASKKNDTGEAEGRGEKSPDNKTAGENVLIQTAGKNSCIRRLVNEAITGQCVDSFTRPGQERGGKRRNKAYGDSLNRYLHGDAGRKKRTVDIPLLRNAMVLKGKLKRNKERLDSKPAPNVPSTKIIAELLKTRFFQKTELEWTEAILILIEQGRRLLRRILYIKKLSFIGLSNNFDIVHHRPLTTKERKKSRLGTSFHLTREIFKLLGHVAGAFVQYRNCLITPNDLCATLKHIFSNVGVLTGMYRYKYKISKQIRMCKDLHRNDHVWVPQWRVWCNMLRGYIPFLERCIGNLLDRMKNGRDVHPAAETKQRVESGFDIRIKEMIKGELGRSPRILQHFNEKWRCWKADVAYTIKDGEQTRCLDEVNRTLDKCCAMKADWYVSRAVDVKAKEKTEIKKQNGKVLRLYMKNERARQQDYLASPFLKISDAVKIYHRIREYLCGGGLQPHGPGPEDSGIQSRRRVYIPFPEQDEEGVFKSTLCKLKKQSSKSEREFYDGLNRQDAVHRIKKDILAKRVFGDVAIRIKRDMKYTCYYDVHHEERLTDAFLDTYLWYEADKQGLFPAYLQPNNGSEMTVLKEFCLSVKNERGALYKFKYQNIFKKIDLNLLNKLLRIFIDPVVVDFIIARLGCRVVYKDMSLTNAVGVIKGLQFSSFIYAFWTLSMDIVLFRPSEILLRYCDAIFVADGLQQDADVFVSGVIKRMPPSLGCLELVSCSEIPYSFVFNGFCVRFSRAPSHNTIDLSSRSEKPCGGTAAGGDVGSAPCSGSGADQHTPCDFVQIGVTEEAVAEFKNRVRSIVQKSTGATFLKIVNEWNGLVLDFVGRYREALDLDKIRECEMWVQDAIKRGINSRMPVRFPPVIFYSPRSVGGLGMYSISDAAAVQDGCQKRQFRGGESPTVPSITRLFPTWNVVLGSSIREPDPVCEYQKKPAAFLKYTMFRREYIRFSTAKNPRYSYSHIDLSEYDTVGCFGGLDKILEHTLYSSLNIADFSDIQEIWDIPEYGRSTNAQKRGASVLPNKRFVLWWSPTLNRTDVYMGYRQSIEPTGVQMHGKLSSLKVFFVQIFRGRLWQQIHEEAVLAIASVFSSFRVIKNKTGPKKSFRYSGEYDLTLQGEISLCQRRNAGASEAVVYTLHIDVAVLWCDYDTRDIAKEAEKRHGMRKHEAPALVVAIDLCYLRCAVHGCYNDDIKGEIEKAVGVLIKKSNVMQILRERLRVSLSLSLSDSVVTEADMFNVGLVCEVSGGDVFILNVKNGNLYYRSLGAARRQTAYPAGGDEASDGSLARAIIDEHRISSRSPKDLIAAEILKSVSEIGTGQVAVSRDMRHTVNRHIADFTGITVRVYESPLHLKNIKKCMFLGEKTALRNVHNVYFKQATNFTSYCRLKLILLAFETDQARAHALDISYSGEWNSWDESKWAEVERSLREICNIQDEERSNQRRLISSHFDTECVWIGDFVKHSDISRKGQVLGPVKGDELVSKLLRGPPNRRSLVRLSGEIVCGQETGDMRAPEAAVSEASFAIDIPKIRIPVNILVQFRMVANTDRLVRAHIMEVSPFTVSIPPQYLSTIAEPPASRGIISNRPLDYRAGLHIILDDEITVRRWQGSTFVDLAYEISGEYGIFQAADWNFNFRIDQFRRDAAAHEQTPAKYYDPVHRVRHFQKFAAEIKKLQE